MFEAIMTQRPGEKTNFEELECEIRLESLRMIQVLQNTVRQIDPNMATPFIHQQDVITLRSNSQNALDGLQTETRTAETRQELLEVFSITIAKLFQQFLIHFPDYFKYEDHLPIITVAKKEQMENQVDALGKNRRIRSNFNYCPNKKAAKNIRYSAAVNHQLLFKFYFSSTTSPQESMFFG